MNEYDRKRMLKLGLGQITKKRDLKRLRDYIAAGKPILLDGSVYSLEAGYG